MCQRIMQLLTCQQSDSLPTKTRFNLLEQDLSVRLLRCQVSLQRALPMPRSDIRVRKSI